MGQIVWVVFNPNFTGSPLYEELCGYNISQLTLFCYPHLHLWAIMPCTVMTKIIIVDYSLEIVIAIINIDYFE